MANYKKWTDPEKNFIRDNAKIMSDGELANKLCQMTGENISVAMIRRQRRKFEIAKPRGRRPKISTNINSIINHNEIVENI